MKSIWGGSFAINTVGSGTQDVNIIHNWNIAGSLQLIHITAYDNTTPVVADTFSFKVTGFTANSFTFKMARSDGGNSGWTKPIQIMVTIVGYENNTSV
jgi:hypothetical protein